ncbi:MAG: hypothetical protein A4E25_00413 [Methanobacterium sp. PtaB.Bin024]|nr:MAG: hypothetical protein A4E25_00413 [Methanobacterium sp. PtaB.Bin024]
MVFCPECGTEIKEENAKNCPKCGGRIIQASQQSKTSPLDKFVKKNPTTEPQTTYKPPEPTYNNREVKGLKHWELLNIPWNDTGGTLEKWERDGWTIHPESLAYDGYGNIKILISKPK